MDLVTVTDHDSIDSVERLRRHPDFFLSEEVSCCASSGTHLHIGVYGIEERDHIECSAALPISPPYSPICRRASAVQCQSRLLRPDRFAQRSRFRGVRRGFPAVETLNGQMLPGRQPYAEHMARLAGKAAVGGSDAHTLSAWGGPTRRSLGRETPRNSCKACGMATESWMANRAIIGSLPVR